MHDRSTLRDELHIDRGAKAPRDGSEALKILIAIGVAAALVFGGRLEHGAAIAVHVATARSRRRRRRRIHPHG